MDIDPKAKRKACMYDCRTNEAITGSVVGFCVKFQVSCPPADFVQYCELVV